VKVEPEGECVDVEVVRPSRSALGSPEPSGPPIPLAPNGSEMFDFDELEADMDVPGKLVVRVVEPEGTVTLEQERATEADSKRGASGGPDVVAEVNAERFQNSPELFCESSLAVAARDGEEEDVKRLLRQRADPDLVGALGETPLFSAARQGHARVACVLLLGKADPCARSSSGAVAADVSPDDATSSLLRIAAGQKVQNRAQRVAFLALDECQRFLISWNLSKRGVKLAVADVLSESDWAAACEEDSGS